jgi:hypothetical protein
VVKARFEVCKLGGPQGRCVEVPGSKKRWGGVWRSKYYGSSTTDDYWGELHIVSSHQRVQANTSWDKVR